MITVWGRTTSSNVQVVMWAIGELGLPHRRIDAGHVYGGLDSSEFGAMNPNRKIPVLRDGDGPAIWESGAILRYLAARHGDAQFWPEDPARRATLDMWAEWTKTTFLPVVVYKLFWQLVRVPEAKRNHALIAEGEGEARGLATLLDRRLGDGPFLGGEHLCFADVMAGHILYRYYDLPLERAETPHLDAYYARLCERPAYREHVMVSYEPLRA